MGQPKIPAKVQTAFHFLRLINEHEMGSFPYETSIPSKNALSDTEKSTKEAALYVLRTYFQGEHEHEPPPAPKITIFIQPPQGTTLKQFLDGLKADAAGDE